MSNHIRSSLIAYSSVFSSLRRIIWVAARPPVPPFSGITSKTLCGLDALSTMIQVDLVTFAEEVAREATAETLQAYWQNRPIFIHVLPQQRAMSWHQALWQSQFQLSGLFERELLATKLTELAWSSSESLTIFDDIILAPVASEYASNAIISPHDCISRMFLSHCQAQISLFSKLKKWIQFQIAQHYEREFYHKFLLVHVITPRDRVWLEEVNPYARYHVVPNADLLNPGFVRDFSSKWDILIWGDLTVAACVQGTREFLWRMQQDSYLATVNKILIGKVPKNLATRVIGEKLMRQIEYTPYLEDEAGHIRSAKIIVIPDIGGAGMKNRVVNVVSSGLCLACLLPQMEGVEAIADRGAINAVTMDELVKRISQSLKLHTYEQIAALGQHIYQEHYSLDMNYCLWREMIERALSVREMSISNNDRPHSEAQV